MVDSRDKQISRKELFKSVGTAVTGVALGALGGEKLATSEQDLTDEFCSEVREITYEDMKSPGSEKMKSFVQRCAARYAQICGIDSSEKSPDFFVQNTFLHETEEAFVSEARKFGFEADLSSSYGRVFYEQRVAIINLERIAKRSFMETKYPGVLLFGVLIHEWGDLATEKNILGRHLNNGVEKIGNTDDPDAKPESWRSYRGGKIITDNLAALNLFDNAWNELATREIVSRSMEGNHDLLMADAALHDNIAYHSRSSKLLRIWQSAGVTLREASEMHRYSKVEEMFHKMGSAFSAESLNAVPEVTWNGRSREEAESVADFLIGKRIAFLIEKEEWDEFGEILKYLKKE